jgi:hypothetical protein
LDLKHILDWFVRAKLIMVEIASSASFGMFLFWALWQEYRRLFRHRPIPRGKKETQK